MRGILRILAAAFCLGCALLVVACSDSDDRDEPIVVELGVVQSITGSGSVYAPSTLNGIELAIKEVETAEPRIRFEYEILDDESSIERGIAVYEQLRDDGVDAIIGPTLSNVGLQSLRVANEAGIPAISPITTASGIGAIGDYVFRIALAEDASLPLLVEFVAKRESLDEAVLIFDSADAYSRSAAEAMRRGISAAGAQISREIDLAASEPAGLASLPEVQAADVFLLPLIVEPAVPVLQELRGAGLTQPAIGGEALATTDLVDLAGPATDGLYVASTWHPDVDNEATRAFVKAYEDAYGQAPAHFAAESYTAVRLLADAVLRAGSTDAEAVRDALAATSEFETLLGSLSMSEEGDAVFTPVFQQFLDGDLVIIEQTAE